MMATVESPRRFYLLDALRGVAAFLIFLFHIHNANYFVMDGFWIAVDLFFILSGFVLFPDISRISNSKIARKFLIKRIIRLAPLPILTILFMTFRQHNDAFQSIKYVQPSSATAILISLLLLQILSMQAVAVNLTLWSLSTEFWVNFIGAVFHSRRMMTVLLVLSSLVLGISIIYGLPTEYGLLALSRTCLGFNAGMLVRKYSNRLVHHRKRLILSAISLIPLFHLAGQTTFAIFLAVPLFSILTLEISKAEPHLMTTKFQNICNFLGRNSFGIYVWQVPINSLVQARNITTLFNLNESSPTTFFLVVLVKFSAILAISELTTRFYEEPIQALLRSSTFSKK